MLDTIDVSFCQKTIDWAKVKKAGIKNALIQIGGGDLSSQKDSYFKQNYKNAKAQGIKVGGYWVSYIGDDALVDDYVEDAKLEAKACLSCIKGKTFDFPIYHDLEVKSVQTKKIQAATMAFCAAIEAGGYKAGVYASNDFFDAYLDYKAIKAKYSIWLAQWNVSKPSKDCDIWQYSESGNCSGITTTVDYDKMYTSFGPRKEYVTVKVQLAGKNYIPRLGVTLNAYRILKSCGYNVGTKPTDNDPYPAQLSEAVKAYQKKFNLPQTGDLDAATTISMGSFEKA
jgi:GH25 family lysozyme M1 (1,4-beta-N-acetylmuramidase)